MMRHASLLLIGMSLLGCASRADRPDEGDLAKLQGTWEAKLGPQHDIAVVLKINDDRAFSTLTMPDGKEVTVRSEIKLHEETDPRQWDWLNNAGPDGKSDLIQRAIYRLDGDTLTLCNGASDRPTEFRQGENGVPALKVYHRVGDRSTDRNR